VPHPAIMADREKRSMKHILADPGSCNARQEMNMVNTKENRFIANDCMGKTISPIFSNIFANRKDQANLSAQF
jgi:hypothetical protein